MNLKLAIDAAVERLIASEAIEAAIQQQIAKTVIEVVTHELRPYSEFGKLVTEKVKQALVFHDETLALPSYNACILQILRAQVEQRTNAIIQQQIVEQMDNLLEPAPESITLSALVQKFIDRQREEQHAGCVCFGEMGQISLHVKEDRTAGFWTLCLDGRKDKTDHECEIRIGVYKDSLYHLTFHNATVEKQMFAGPFYGFERMLFQMRAAGTKLLRDCDPSEIETSYSLGHDHENPD
jgi:hypothetical protein